MQAAVNAEMRVAANTETTVEVMIGRRSEDNGLKMGSAGWLEHNLTR